MNGIELRGFGFFAKAPMSHALTYGRIPEHPDYFQKSLKIVHCAVTDYGYLFVVRNRYSPTDLDMVFVHLDGFYRFMHSAHSDGMTRKKLLSMKNEQVQHVDAFFKEWIAHEYEKEFKPLISAGAMTFEQAYAVWPQLETRPSFQEFFERCRERGEIPKAKRGKRAVTREPVILLYEYASRYAVDFQLSWEDACHEAVTEHPELVPKTWQEDPAGTLKRYAHRRLDKTIISQHSYRLSGKKVQ